jgi:cytochrome c oxidase subunit 1
VSARPAVAGSAAAEAAARAGIVAWIATTDHKRVAVRMAAAALFFFLLSGAFALLIRAELADPGLQLVGEDAYNQLFTMHGSGMIYLVFIPLALAVGVYFVPLQVGAAQIAAPRATLFGHWLILSGGLTMFSGMLTLEGGGKVGWTSYYPLSGEQPTPGTGMELWLIGVILAMAGALIVAACVLATIIRLRAPGMTMLRIPIFSWTMVATTLLVVMSFPPLLAAMGFLLADRIGLGDPFADEGGPILYQNLFWFFAHPAVYVMFFPFLGIAADIVATFSRRRWAAYKVLIFALMAFTALSMSVWAHHQFTTGQVTNQYFSATSTLLAIPAGMEYFGAALTMIGGSILLRTPMLFALGFFLQFLIGGLSGIFIASPPLDYHVHDSFFIVAHFHYTLFGGSLFGLFAGIYYWFPKVTGAMLREGLGRLHFVLLVVGTNLTFFPMFFLGHEGMPRRIADYSPADGFTDLNRLSTIGAFVIAIAIAVFLWNLVVSLHHREPAGDDPWEGQTLEWATSSPPPRFNFARLPRIRSFAPLLDLRLEAEAERQRGSGER